MTAFSPFQSAPAIKPTQQAVVIQAGQPINQSINQLPHQSNEINQSIGMNSPPIIARVPSSSQYAHPAILFSPRSHQSINQSITPVMAVTLASTNSDAESLILSRNNSPAVTTSDASSSSINQSPKSINQSINQSAKSRRPKSSKSNSETKLKKRLARKAELARASRRRKKAYISGLEDEIVRLKSQVDRMKSAASTGIACADDITTNQSINQSIRRTTRRQLRAGLKSMSECESESDESCTSDDSASEEQDESINQSINQSIHAFNSMDVGPSINQSINQSLSVKVSYLDETRRFTLCPITYLSLCDAVRSFWRHVSFPVLCYIDEDGDSVRMTREEELREAFRNLRSNSLKLILQDIPASGNQSMNQSINQSISRNDSDTISIQSQDSLPLERRFSHKRKHHSVDKSINQSKRRTSESQRSDDSGSPKCYHSGFDVHSINQSINQSFPSLSLPHTMPMTSSTPTLWPINQSINQSINSSMHQSINQSIIYPPSHLCVMLCLELVSEVSGQLSVTRAFCSLPLVASFHSLRDYLARTFLSSHSSNTSNYVFVIGAPHIRTRVYDEQATLMSYNCQAQDLVQFIHESLLVQSPGSCMTRCHEQEIGNTRTKKKGQETEQDETHNAASVISTLAQATSNNIITKEITCTN